MSITPLPEAQQVPRGIEKYLSNGEYVILTSRRHSVVLESAVLAWLAALALGFAAIHNDLTPVGMTLVLAGTGFLVWKACNWWLAKYIFTNDRVLLVEGVLGRQVNGLPLRMVLDTTYRRSMFGRFLGYGDLELNLSGQPGLRILSFLPSPDRIYGLLISLINRRDLTA